MLTKATPKRDRVHLRLDAATKRKLERAATYAQKSVTEFVLSQAVEAADHVIKTHEQHVLSTADWETFCEALDRPSKPNRALKEGFRWYRTTTA
ncbi:MAG: type II toxin-antitoxin system TacA family antitoxin [Acidiferrobacterales bacterium]